VKVLLGYSPHLAMVMFLAPRFSLQALSCGLLPPRASVEKTVVLPLALATYVDIVSLVGGVILENLPPPFRMLFTCFLRRVWRCLPTGALIIKHVVFVVLVVLLLLLPLGWLFYLSVLLLLEIEFYW
jgi:hypothetical protein